MSRFQRSHDPDRPGEVLLDDGVPLGLLYWSHDFADRAGTGWFLARLDADGEPADAGERLDVAEEIDQLVADTGLERAEWLERAEVIELTTAQAALAEAERTLARDGS